MPDVMWYARRELPGLTDGRLVRNNAGRIADSLLSDDGSTLTLTAGNFVPNADNVREIGQPSTAFSYGFFRHLHVGTTNIHHTNALLLFGSTASADLISTAAGTLHAIYIGARLQAQANDSDYSGLRSAPVLEADGQVRTISTFSHIRIDDATHADANLVIPNAYGIYIAQQTSGTANYSLFVNAGTSYFGGTILGTSTNILQLTATWDDDANAVASPRIRASAAGTSSMLGSISTGANAGNAGFHFFKTRSTGTDANTAVASSDQIHTEQFYAADGAAYRNVSQVLYKVESYTGADNVSGYISWWTRPDGAAASITERWRIISTGTLDDGTLDANARAIGISSYSLTGSSALEMINLAGTWNTTGTPSAIKLVITDTASNAASKFLDLQTAAGGVKFAVTKAGEIVAASGYLEIMEQSAPAAGERASCRLFTVDGGAGKRVLKAQFGTGAAVTVATEP